MVGAPLWALTGNADWMPLMMGAGAFRGGTKGLMASRPAGATGGFETKWWGGWAKPNRFAANMAIGTAAGVAMDNPNFAVFGALGLPLAKGAARFMMNPAHARRATLGMLQTPFSPAAAARTFSKMDVVQAGAGMGAIGVGAGVGYEMFRLALGPRNNDVTSGYYPGGVAPLHPGGRGIPNNHLSTEGLTLALHKNGRRTRYM
jgi:hypothetical protein